MSDELLVKRYALGTHRLVAPEETLARITPALAAMGITRTADITGLDRLGVATYCAMRPAAQLVQIANGKGLTAIDARVSALMEAIEVFHAEYPTLEVTHASFRALSAQGRAVVNPTELPGFQSQRHYDDARVLDWVEACELNSGERCLIPASAAYPTSPSLYAWWTNGLASGNHIVEATLHALYEIIERHAMALTVLPDADPFAIFRPRVKYLRLATVTSPEVHELALRIAQAEMKLVLATVRSPVPVHTFWAVILDRRPLATSTLINTGYGTHASPTVAAIRAITEAAQSRLSMIHASREDLGDRFAKADAGDLKDPFAFFDGVTTSADWRALTDYSHASLSEDYTSLLAALATSGVPRVFRVDLTRPPFDIPVVKIIVPGMLFDDRWM